MFETNRNGPRPQTRLVLLSGLVVLAASHWSAMAIGQVPKAAPLPDPPPNQSLAQLSSKLTVQSPYTLANPALTIKYKTNRDRVTPAVFLEEVVVEPKGDFSIKWNLVGVAPITPVKVSLAVTYDSLPPKIYVVGNADFDGKDQFTVKSADVDSFAKWLIDDIGNSLPPNFDPATALATIGAVSVTVSPNSPSPQAPTPSPQGQAPAPQAPAPSPQGQTPTPQSQAPAPQAPAPSPQGQTPPSPQGQTPSPQSPKTVPQSPKASPGQVTTNDLAITLTRVLGKDEN